jgi:beta-lactamase regulating signal transducer with metallopeptidase domain/Leucine-rich repeat (LRR) protein
MNEVINSCTMGLNNAGQVFCDYAAGMFVQSSVLIIVLLIIDFVLRKRARATLRYCVWLLVFVKLVLPPTLCLPTGIGYWCGDYLSADLPLLRELPSIVQPDSVGTHTSGDFAQPVETHEPQPSRALPGTMAPAASAISSIRSITWQAIVFFAWLFGVLVISILLIQRIRFVKWLIAQSSPAQGQSLEILNQSCRQLGIRRNIGLRLSPNTSSPAACGLFKPIVLMPASLTEDLSPDKLKAVFIHELAHIKRADLWVNFGQTLLQIVYFYNPFVWLANTVVRRIREQAVDEMVLAAIGTEAKSYSNALIDIAEMAFWQASFSLRLIGVVESKKALHRRIRHMLTRPMPKSAKIGVFGLLTIIVIAALLLPMAARAKTPQNSSRVLHFPRDRSLGIINIQDAHTVRQIKDFHYWIDKSDWWNPDWEYLSEARGDVTVPAGKHVALFVNKAAWKDLSPLSELGSDDLYMLALPGSIPEPVKPDDRCMPHLAGLTGLKVLNLNWTDVSSKGLQSIRKLKRLERLYLPNQISNAGLSHVAELQSLKGLYFNQNKVTNTGLAHLAKLSSLEELELGGGRISDAGLIHLAKLPKLRYLLLWGNFSDAGMAQLKNIPSLRILQLGRLPITDAGLAHLSDLTGLENLDLNGTRITNKGLAALKSMHSLKKLNLGGTEATEDGFVHLKDIKTLEYLDLPSESVTDKGLSYLAQLGKLKHLRMPSPHYVDPNMDKKLYTDEGLEELAKLQSLEELLIAGLGVTDAGMSHVAKLKNLKDLHIFGCPITNQGLAKLTALKSLRRLTLYETKVTISGLAQLNVLPDLILLHATDIERDNSFLNISGLTKLENLTIGTTHTGGVIRDEDLACLANLKQLKWFQISSAIKKPMAISDTGMAHLVGLTNISRLTIGGPNLTDNGLKYLANMKNLDLLNIIGGKFTDKALRHLEGLKTLRYLSIDAENDFSPAALDHLRRRLPNLQTLKIDNKDAGYGGIIAGARKKTEQG